MFEYIFKIICRMRVFELFQIPSIRPCFRHEADCSRPLKRSAGPCGIRSRRRVEFEIKDSKRHAEDSSLATLKRTSCLADSPPAPSGALVGRREMALCVVRLSYPHERASYRWIPPRRRDASRICAFPSASRERGIERAFLSRP